MVLDLIRLDPALLWLGNVLKEFFGDNIKKNGLYRYVYDFSVDYDTIDVDDFLDIQKYLKRSMI